jgi:DNA-binding MarR family transcriptional regulator
MSTRTLSSQGLSAWVAFLHGHAALTRALNAQLIADHGLTINDYEVLLRLSRAPERRLKRVELAQSVLLTPSGITRLLDGLEAAGWVEKAPCASDARITYAVLTGRGAEKLRAAAGSHLADVDRLFAAHFADPELETLARLLGRLDAAGPDGDTTCEPCEAA